MPERPAPWVGPVLALVLGVAGSRGGFAQTLTGPAASTAATRAEEQLFQQLLDGQLAESPLLQGPLDARGAAELAKRFQRCLHLRGHDPVPGPVGASWHSPRDGELLFENAFDNWSDSVQSYAEELEREVATFCDCSLELKLACAKVGVAVKERLKKTFTIQVPAHCRVEATAHARLMDRTIEILLTCVDCREVLSVFDGHVTAARGIHEVILPARSDLYPAPPAEPR